MYSPNQETSCVCVCMRVCVWGGEACFVIQVRCCLREWGKRIRNKWNNLVCGACTPDTNKKQKDNAIDVYRYRKTPQYSFGQTDDELMRTENLSGMNVKKCR